MHSAGKFSSRVQQCCKALLRAHGMLAFSLVQRGAGQQQRVQCRLSRTTPVHSADVLVAEAAGIFFEPPYDNLPSLSAVPRVVGTA
jgi:hypothetical protein